MNWNRHSEVEGMHAFLSPSKYYWTGYDENKIAGYYKSQLAAARGSELHEFAASCIRLGQRLPKNQKTLNTYVNDAIGYKMSPEVALYYSPNCFGTTDAISFRNGMLAAQASSGTEKRTISQPAFSSSKIWASVASRSLVLVKVMD